MQEPARIVRRTPTGTTERSDAHSIARGDYPTGSGYGRYERRAVLQTVPGTGGRTIGTSWDKPENNRDNMSDVSFSGQRAAGHAGQPLAAVPDGGWPPGSGALRTDVIGLITELFPWCN